MRIRIRLVTLMRLQIRIRICQSLFDADPDPTFHFDPDPNPTFHLDGDPGPYPDTSFQIKVQNLEKVPK
jgi:hypothetical protein